VTFERLSARSARYRPHLRSYAGKALSGKTIGRTVEASEKFQMDIRATRSSLIDEDWSVLQDAVIHAERHLEVLEKLLAVAGN
jgi:hypothetical protein